MNWRWLIYDYIPVELNVPKNLKRTIRREVKDTSFINLNTNIPLRVVIFIALFIAELFLLGTLWVLLASLIYAVLITMVCSHLALGILMRKQNEKKTYQVLSDHGYGICANCGYLLFGLSPDHTLCPECGTKREPLVEQSETFR